MATVRVMLAPLAVIHNMYAGTPAEKMATVRCNFNYYTTLPHMRVKGSGKDASEEVFDLTNNPCRQDERLDKYGNGRSVSVGDIVLVDNVMFLCLQQGWQEFTA
jgi:hypothetical protein